MPANGKRALRVAILGYLIWDSVYAAPEGTALPLSKVEEELLLLVAVVVKVTLRAQLP